MHDGGSVAVAGIVQKVGKKFTRKGELMYILEMEDLEATCEVIVFPQTAEKVAELIVADKVLCIRGRVDKKEDTPKLVAMEITEPDYKVIDNPVRLKVPAAECTPKLVGELKHVLLDYPGTRPVFLHLSGEKGKETVLRLGPTSALTRQRLRRPVASPARAASGDHRLMPKESADVRCGGFAVP